MSVFDLAARISDMRSRRHAAELKGDVTTARDAAAELAAVRKKMDALPPDERARLMGEGVPTAFLPVRVETAFAQTRQGGQELRLRVYPDTLHLSDFDPRVTATQLALAEDVNARAQNMRADERAALTAWMDTVTGAARGAWLRDAVQNGAPALRDDDDTLATTAGLLPDRWQVTLSWDGGSHVTEFPALVADPLPMGPSAGDRTGLFADGTLETLWAGRGVQASAGEAGMAWMIDFAAALEAGMACIVDLNAAGLERHLAQGGQIDRIEVTGLRWVASEHAAAELAQHMTGHVLRRNARIALQGSPTRNDGTQGMPPAPATLDGPNAARLAGALGLSKDALALLGDGPQDEDALAQAMSTALWPGSVGLYAEALFGVGPDKTLLLEEFFHNDLRARGPLPALQIGQEVYGVLPLTVDGQGTSRPDARDDFEQGLAARIEAFLKMVRRPVQDWASAPDDFETWLDLFGQEANPGALTGLPFGVMASGTRDAGIDQIIADLGLPKGGEVRHTLSLADPIEVAPRLPLSRYASDARNLSARTETDLLDRAVRLSLADLFDILPEERWPVHPYREMPFVRSLFATNSGWGLVQDGAAPGDPVLFTLLRHAIFTHLAALMRAFVVAQDGKAPGLTDPVRGPGHHPLIARFAELSGLDPAELSIPLSADVARHLATPSAVLRQNQELHKALITLARAEGGAPALELAMREHLGLISHRIDAWVTALDARRLARQRGQQPEGIAIGGYGMAYGLAPAKSPMDAQVGEFIPATSPAQAKTAAVLRAGYTARLAEGGAPDAFALSLTSDAARRATQISDAVQAGRSMAEVLGQRAEQNLRRSLAGQPDVLHRTVKTLRANAPLRENLRAGVQDAATGGDVMDGLKLLEMDAAALPVAAQGVIADLKADMRALSDTMLAEAVHNVIAAGPDRAGAALDALSRGGALPQSMGVLETPRAGAGLGITALALGAARDVPDSNSPVGAIDFAEARAVAAGPLAGVLDNLAGDLARFGLWQDSGAGPVWITLDRLGYSAAALVLATRAGRPAACTLIDKVAGVVQPETPGPNAEPSLETTLTFFAELRALSASAAPLADTSLGQGGKVQAADAAARVAYLRHCVDEWIAAFDRANTPEDITARLHEAQLLGRTDAISEAGLSDADQAALAAALRARMAQSLREADALDNPAEAARTLLGGDVFVLPALGAAAQSALNAEMTQSAPLANAHDPVTCETWLFEAAEVRPKLAATCAAFESAEALRGETVLQVTPLQNALAPKWAAVEARGYTGAKASAVIGPVPARFDGGIVFDDWTEVIPDVRQDAAMAIEIARPTARAPQAIVLALSDASWTSEAPALMLTRLRDLMALRALGPDDITPLRVLPPVLSFLEPSQ